MVERRREGGEEGLGGRNDGRLGIKIFFVMKEWRNIGMVVGFVKNVI